MKRLLPIFITFVFASCINTSKQTQQHINEVSHSVESGHVKKMPEIILEDGTKCYV